MVYTIERHEPYFIDAIVHRGGSRTSRLSARGANRVQFMVCASLMTRTDLHRSRRTRHPRVACAGVTVGRYDLGVNVAVRVEDRSRRLLT